MRNFKLKDKVYIVRELENAEVKERKISGIFEENYLGLIRDDNDENFVDVERKEKKYLITEYYSGKKENHKMYKEEEFIHISDLEKWMRNNKKEKTKRILNIYEKIKEQIENKKEEENHGNK